MPCSVLGHSYPSPGPPHAWMKSPAALNSRTGGAALDFSSADKVRGRCNTHTLSCESTFELDTIPRIHWLGTFGQIGSPLNFGTSRAADVGPACAAAVRPSPGRPTSMTPLTNPRKPTLGPTNRFMAASLSGYPYQK